MGMMGIPMGKPTGPVQSVPSLSEMDARRQQGVGELTDTANDLRALVQLHALALIRDALERWRSNAISALVSERDVTKMPEHQVTVRCWTSIQNEMVKAGENLVTIEKQLAAAKASVPKQ